MCIIKISIRPKRTSLAFHFRPTEFMTANASIGERPKVIPHVIQKLVQGVSKQDMVQCDRDRFSMGVRSLSTKQQIRGAVVNFEKWLKFSEFGDERRIDKVPPEILDEYLAVYFRDLKKVSGEEYSIGSLKSLRSCMEHYLKEAGYPFSIIGDQKFVRSQDAFKQKLLKLK